MGILDAIFGEGDSGVPKWYEDAAEHNINFAQQASKMPPPIWSGPTVAEVPGALRGAWDQSHAWNLAAGLPTGAGGPQGRGVTPSQEFDARMAPYKVQGGYSHQQPFAQGMQATNEAYPGIFDSLYNMYPALAPEGYQYGQGGQGGVGSSWFGAGMDMAQAEALGRALWEAGGDGSTGGDQGAGSIANPTGQDFANIGMNVLSGPVGVAIGLMGNIAATGITGKNMGQNMTTTSAIKGLMDFLGINPFSEQGLAGVDPGLGWSGGTGDAQGNIGAGDLGDMGISGDDAGIGLGPDGGVAW